MNNFPNGQNFTQNGNIGQPNGMPVYPVGQNSPQQQYPGQPVYIPVYPAPPVFDPKKEEKRKNKKILSSMGFCFGLSIILYVVLSIVLVFAVMGISKFFPAAKLLLDDSTGTYAYEGIGSILILGGPFLISHLILKSKKLTGILPFGTTYNKKASISLVMMMTPVVLISSILINLVSMLFQEAVGLTFESGLEDLSVNGVGGAFALIVSIAFIPAIIEEFCIRGVVLQPLRRYGDFFAIMMSSIIFSILHGNMVQIPYTIVAGFYFGYVCVATGSLWPSIVLHFINNLFSAIELIVLENFSEEVANTVTLVMLGVLVLVGIAGGVIFFKMNYKTKLQKGVTTLKTREKYGAVLSNPAMIIAIVIMLIITAKSVSSTGA